MPEKKVITGMVCSKCGKSIINKDVKITGHPSVEMIAEFTDSQGEKIITHIYLSSIWKNYEIKIKNNLLIPMGTVLKLSCPHCKKEFHVSSQKCERSTCKGQTIILLTDDEIIYLCTEKGCHWHKLAHEKKNGHKKTIREVDKNYIPFKGRITGIFC